MSQPEYDSYVVRVYRRDRKYPARLSGVIEVVAKGTTHLFTGMEDLVAIMQGEPTRPEVMQAGSLSPRKSSAGGREGEK